MGGLLDPPALAPSSARQALHRQANLLRGYSIVADLNRPFYGMISEPFDAGVSIESQKTHVAVCDAEDLVVLYANWKGASDTTNGPGTNPIYVRCGFGNPTDNDAFPATFQGGTLAEATVDVGRVVATDPIAGSKIYSGQRFMICTYARVDVVTATVDTTNGSPTLASLASSTGTFYVGQYIYGTGIPAGTTITAVASTTLTISANATADGSGVTVTAYGQIPIHSIRYSADGDYITASSTGAATALTTDRTADTTMMSWHVNTVTSGYGAALILGRTARIRPVRAMFARVDSIGSGSGDNTPAANVNTGSYHRLGWVERTFGDDGIVMLGHGGVTKRTMTRNATSASIGYRQGHAQRFAAGCTGGIFEDGTNDVGNWNASTNTQAQIQADFIKDWRVYVGQRGNPGWQATILPRVTSSTDKFLTDANQTATAYEAIRVAINDWLRDGAPINADFTLAATGASGAGVSRCPYLSWSGTAWVKTTNGAATTDLHPLAYGGVVEVADAVETSRDSGKWARQWVGTGTTTNGSSSVTSVTTTAGAFVASRVVAGTGITTSTTGTLSGSTLTLSVNATASGTVTIGQALTADGTHPSTLGHDKIVTWMEQAGSDGNSARSLITASCNVPT